MSPDIRLSSFRSEAKSLPGSATKIVPPTDVEIAQSLIRIPSYESEAPAGQFIAEFIQEFGPAGFHTEFLPVGVQGRESVLISNSPRPKFIINNHFDTVPDWVVGNEPGQGQFDPRGATIENGRLYGRGASDQKGSTASILRALAEYRGREDELPEMMIALTSMEEEDLQGALAVSDRLRQLGMMDPNYHPAFILEPGADKQLGWQCRGCIAFGGEFQGVSGHAAMRTPGTPEPISAFERGVDTLLTAKQAIYNASETGLGRTTTNIASGRFGLEKRDKIGRKMIGAKSDNRVPDRFRFRWESRPNGGTFDGEPITAETIMNLLDSEAFVRGLNVAKFRVGLDIAGWAGDREDTKWIEEIARDVLHVEEIAPWNAHEHGLAEVAIIHGGASDDGRRKVGAAIFGTADSTQFHKPDESIAVADVAPQTEIFRRAISDFKLHFS